MNKQAIEKAIKYIHNIMTETDIYCGQSKKMSEEDKEYLEMLQIAINSMKQQLTDGWIPVSERLPKEEGCYLATLKHKEFGNLHVDLLDYDKEMFCYRDNLQKRWWEVIAWRFMPEPYKEVKNE